MPYEGEFSQYGPIRRLVEDKRISELLTRFRVKGSAASSDDFSELLFQVEDQDIRDAWEPEWVLSIDGGGRPADVKNGYPGAEAAYLTVASVFLNVKQLKKLDEARPIDPKSMRETQRAESIDGVLPGRNVLYEDALTARESLRRIVYELFRDTRALENDESLLDTYEVLLSYKPAQLRQECPYIFDENCIDDEQAYLRGKNAYSCKCTHARSLYSTDALRIHERFTEVGSNAAIYSEISQVLEALWIIHILRSLESKNLLGSLGKLAIMLDGPLAIFGQPAWLSAAISRELRRLNDKVRSLTRKDILLVGIEKSGQFVDHFMRLDQAENPKQGKLNPGTMLLLTDGYIKQHVNPSESTKPYGANTYYGRKFLYKTRRRSARIVATVPYLHDDHSDWTTATLNQFPRLQDTLGLLDGMVSTRYPNALMPIVAAHSEASIPLNLGKKILEKLARELIQDNN